MAREEPSVISEAKGEKQRGWRFYLSVALIALALIFVIQNTEKTNVSFLFAETEMPLFFALIVALALGALIGWLAPRVRRGSRKDEE